MPDARERHVEALRAARQEYNRTRGDTPHRWDLLRHIHRLEKELRIYDHLRRQAWKSES